MKYLQIDYKEMKFYESSKTAEAGFTEHTSSKGNVSFRKWFDKGVSGSYLGTYKKETDGFGTKMNVNINIEGEKYILSIDLFDQKGNISKIASYFIVYLDNLMEGESYRFFPYSFIPKEDSKYPVEGVSIHNVDKVTGEKKEKIEKTYFYTKKGETAQATSIPTLVFEQKHGKTKPTAVSLEAQNDFFYSVLEKNMKEFTQSPSENRTVPEPETSQKNTTEELVNDFTENNDDLPF